MGRGQRHSSPSSICDGDEERYCRRAISFQASNWKRMDSPSRSSRRTASQVASDDRPFRDLPKFPSSNLLLPDVRPTKCRNRRLPSDVVESSGLCFSASSNSQEGSQQVHDLTELPANIDRPLLATKRVVSRSSDALSKQASGPSRKTRPFKATTFSSVPSQSPKLETSCVEAGIELARAAGFSQRAAQIMSWSRRDSTKLNYQSKWSVFKNWCKTEKVDLKRPTLPIVAEFLTYLFDVRKLSVTAIKGYRSMLSAVYFSILPDISSSRFMRELIRGLENKTLKKVGSPFPSWNLVKTLEYLKGPMFEPLDKCDWRQLTKKTLFLVALATAKRVGELQAISTSVSFQNRDILLSYLPEFVAKTETLKNPIPRSFLLKSLTPGEEETGVEECLLCPVRALRIYLQRSETLSHRPRSLFVSPSNPKRPISKNAISFFLRETIAQAASLSTDQCRAHDVRGISASASFWSNWPLSKILEAACWRSANVFANHYLKDIMMANEDCMSLGPFTTAGLAVHGTHR